MDSEFFGRAITKTVALYREHYGPRLVSMYVYGSVHRGEALARVSDLDLLIITTDAFNAGDQEWELARWQKEQDATSYGSDVEVGLTRANALGNVHRYLRPTPEENSCLQDALYKATGRHELSAPEYQILGAGRLVRTICYDATLVWGQDLAKDISPPTLGREWATLYFQAPYDLVCYEAQGQMPTGFVSASLPPLPLEPNIRLRKMARVAVWGGACLLMAHAKFASFRINDVLAGIGGEEHRWGGFLECTRQYAFTPPRSVTSDAEAYLGSVTSDAEAYLAELALWMDWVAEELSNAKFEDAI